MHRLTIICVVVIFAVGNAKYSKFAASINKGAERAGLGFTFFLVGKHLINGDVKGRFPAIPV